MTNVIFLSIFNSLSVPIDFPNTKVYLSLWFGVPLFSLMSVDMCVDVSVDLSVDMSLQLSQDEVLSVALVGRPIICTNCCNFSRRGHRRCFSILSSSPLSYFAFAHQSNSKLETLSPTN